MKSHLLQIAAGTLLVTGLSAQQTFPKPDYQPKPSPLVGEFAEPGGKFSAYLMQFPKSFNYLLDNNVGSKAIFDVLFLPLLSINELDLEFEPLLADQWTISDDKLTFTLRLRNDAVWSDGQPITAHDVAWTFEAIMKDENLTGVHKVGLDRFASVTALDDKTVAFKAKEVHFLNLVYVGGFSPLPKHWWEKQEFNKVNFSFPVVNGPYRFGELKEPNYIRLEKRPDFWGAALPEFENVYNFDTIEYRFYPEQDMALEAFLKNETDFFSVYTSYMWVERTKGEKFEKNWIVKQGVDNYDPVGFQGWVFNLRREKFQDVRVRKAIAHCVNREEFNQTLMFNQYFLHRSYWEEVWDADHPCPNEPFEFNPAKARQLLDEAGWKTNPRTGIREKDGKPLEIAFLERDGSSKKFLLPFQEVLKDVGIRMTIDQKDWSQWTKDMDEYNFDMTWAAWASSIFENPEGMWHSKWAATPSGNNYPGYKNPEVDALIDSMRTEFDAAKRRETVRKIDEIIYKDFPYVLLWNRDYHRILYWNKFGTPPHVLGKILREEEGSRLYWWIDPDQDADLQSAMASGTPMPPRPARVNFDDAFSADAVRSQPVQ